MISVALSAVNSEVSGEVFCLMLSLSMVVERVIDLDESVKRKRRKIEAKDQPWVTIVALRHGFAFETKTRASILEF